MIHFNVVFSETHVYRIHKKTYYVSISVVIFHSAIVLKRRIKEMVYLLEYCVPQNFPHFFISTQTDETIRNQQLLIRIKSWFSATEQEWNIPASVSWSCFYFRLHNIIVAPSTIFVFQFFAKSVPIFHWFILEICQAILGTHSLPILSFVYGLFIVGFGSHYSAGRLPSH